MRTTNDAPDEDAASRKPTDERLYRTLADAFGFRTFRPYQEEIVRAILDGRDAFAVMPTGGGKSLCYQLPALLTPGVCVVVSPLLSLMKDQVDAAQKNGICAATLNSTTPLSEMREIAASVERGALDLLYVSPERFNSERFQNYLKSVELGFFAIDEAHCISQWGHNFRADYLELGKIAELFPNCPIAAFTATATEQVADDIKSLLNLRDPFCVKASFDRPNLFYQIAYKEDFERQLLDFLKDVPNESGIVYRATRKNVEKTAAFLQKNGFQAKAYHAGMTDADRAAVQEEFANDETPIIVATIAFGMGIDKSNVRFVVHGDLPKDVESYYQETGRAGRDGAPARCLLMYGYQDVAIHRNFLNDYQDPAAKEAASERLNEMVKFAETDGCRRINLLKYFGETYVPPDFESDENDGENGAKKTSESDAKPTSNAPPNFCGSCDYCVGEVRRVDATIDAQKALSAMQRTGNRFGVGHLVDVLTGTKTEKIERFRHDELPTFGVGADRDKTYWRYLIAALLTQGLAELDDSREFSVPRVSALGWETMRGKRNFQIAERPDRKKKNKNARRTAAGSGSSGGGSALSASTAPYDKNALSGRDRRLFETLRALRSQIAKDESVPPYVVFSDKTLVDMVYLKPTTDGDFLLVSGVGTRKLENYGYEFMQEIEKFLENNPQ